MDLRQLRYFVAIAQSGSISAAADTVHIAQPALSRQLRLLEEELGVLLLDRSATGVVPTSAGLVLLDRSQDLLARAEAMKAEVRDTGRRRTTMRLGVPAALSSHLDAAFLERFLERCPSVSLHITEAWTGTIAQLLANRQIDVGVVCESQIAPFERALPLFSEFLFLIEAHRDGHERRVHVEARDIAAVDLVLPTRENGTRLTLDTFFKTCGIRPQIKYEVASWATIKSLVEDGRAAAILPLREAWRTLDRGRVDARRIVEPPLESGLYLAAREASWSDERDVAVAELAAALRDVVAVDCQASGAVVTLGAGPRYLARA